MKYYAVQKGREPGIYMHWDDCKKQVDGFTGAVYKSFNNFNDALAFLNGDGYEKKASKEISIPETAYAFIDGSFNPTTGISGFGGFLVSPVDSNGNRTEIILQGVITDEEFCRQRNVAGEISGAIGAIKAAAQNNYSELTLFYDYEGIEKWATGEWRTNNPYTSEYAKIIQEYMQTMEICFVHTEGHTGIPGNERADYLAKEVVGIV